MANIIGKGALTPVGSDSASSFLAFRSGINQYNESSMKDHRREPVINCSVPTMALSALAPSISNSQGLSTTEKHIVRLCASPLLECLGSFSKSTALPLFLSVSEVLPPSAPVVTDKVIKAIAIQTTQSLDEENSQIFPNGRAGGIEALAAAMQYLETSGEPFAIVGGVETYFGCHERISHLEWEGRLHTKHSMQGFVPGEAAGFVLLASNEACKQFNLNAYLTVYPPGMSEEAGHMYAEEPYTGDGLATAVSMALNKAPQNAVDHIFSTFNGESFWVKEFGVASVRNSGKIADNVIHEHPADCYGDIGAASLAVMLGFICVDQSSKHASVWCSSDMALRGAVYVHK